MAPLSGSVGRAGARVERHDARRLDGEKLDASMEKIFTGDLKHVNVHAAGSGNPPVLACADLY